ncbi:MAG: hypothetical protein A2X46_07495 [Lentisphaerae bacterium GWF2_57_35]|nr:MAG: hypothetical protein A2X46_07495 [Lentisphaerae bacterium GWF2_57_35]
MNWSVHANFWCAAAENVWRRRGNTLSVMAPLLLAVMVFAAFSFVQDGLVRDALRSAEVMPDLTVQRMIGGRTERVPVALGELVAGMAGVKTVAPRVWGYVPIDLGAGAFAYTLMGIDVSRMPQPEDVGLTLEQGRFLDKKDVNAVVLGKAAAEALDVRLGDELNLKDELGNAGRFQVVGLFAGDVQLHAADLMLVPIKTARNFFGYGEHEATDLCVYLTDSSQLDAAATDILAAQKGLRVLSKDSMRKIVQQVYGKRAGVFQVLWLILLLTVMLTAWAEGSRASHRTSREIGILKATGWSTTNVIELKIFENVIVASAATLGGMLVAMAYLLAGAPGIKSYFLGWAVVYPDMSLPICIGAPTVGLILTVGIFPLLVATVVPAWAAGIVDPDEAMRG